MDIIYIKFGGSSMKKQNRVAGIIFIIAAIFFLLAAIIGESYYFIPIGCCFIVLGVIFINKKPSNKDDK